MALFFFGISVYPSFWCLYMSEISDNVRLISQQHEGYQAQTSWQVVSTPKKKTGKLGVILPFGRGQSEKMKPSRSSSSSQFLRELAPDLSGRDRNV